MDDNVLDSVIDRLMDIDHRYFGARLGLTGPVGIGAALDVELLKGIISAIDELSRKEDEWSRRAAVLVIALSWEHADMAARTAVRGFFIVALSRLGVSPSTVMLDDQYRESGAYSSLSSYRAEIATIGLQIPYSERIGGKSFLLSKFQKGILDSISSDRVVGISAPTSAGKSFAIYLAIARYALVGLAPVIYIVPTISLVNQVSLDIRRLLRDLNIKEWRVDTNYSRADKRSVFVLTQERALMALSDNEPLQEAGILVVDEVQNLERVGDEAELRSKILYDFLQNAREEIGVDKIVLSGPRLENIGELGKIVLGVESTELKTNESPVVGITYSIGRSGGGYVLNQHRDIDRSVASLPVVNSGLIHGIGQSRYTDGFMRYLQHIISSLGPASKNIIFSPTAAQARKTAAGISNSAPPSFESDKLQSLSAYLADSIHPEYDLTRTVKHGVAFHSGRVPPHARLAIEQAFGEGLLGNVVCTTTLMQGVNLPANVVIVRNPNLFIKRDLRRGSAQLSGYEFSNLKGRAGRLMRDFVGRTLVLDEDSFMDDMNQSDLFGSTDKTLSPGYGDMYRKDSRHIHRELESPGGVISGGAKFVVSHVRQAALRYGMRALSKLHDVGVVIAEDQLRQVLASLDTLTISREVCLNNRYWDPFDLQMIKDNSESAGLDALPNTPWEENLADRLVAWLTFQSRVSEAYFTRYLGEGRSHAYILSLALSAESWARERRLSEIISKRRFDSNDADISSKIDDQVSLVYKSVVYGVSAILKPIADIQSTGEALLASIESGAYHPVTRFLISLGLYRETAIEVRSRLALSISGTDNKLEARVLGLLRQGLDELDPWTRRQVESVLI